MTINLSKKPSEYKLIACDLDGTLYDQPRLRKIMALRLAQYFLFHPFKIKELLFVKYYRQIREKWDEIEKSFPPAYDKTNLDDSQYRYVADKYGVDSAYVKETIIKWMHQNPLDAIFATRDVKLLDIISHYRHMGIKVAILSDYPIEEKIKALGFEADAYYSATDERLNELKPSPKGLKIIMDDFGLGKGDVFMIGDRDSKDGECARRAGTDYIIVDRQVSKRDYSIFE